MRLFLRKALEKEKFSVIHNLNEYIREYNVRYSGYVLTGYADCPHELKSGLLRVSLNIGLALDNFIEIYDKLNDTQMRMLEHNLPEFMAWLVNTKYEKSVNYVHYGRICDVGEVVWPICNIIELESEESIIRGIIDLSYMAARVIMEISKCGIPFADSLHLLHMEMRNRTDIVEEFVEYCKQ